jgi:carbonic anhydrase/acetyltransferase-like protein (isoleucine patch superfamily)
MTVWALDGAAPVVHPTAWVHPDATVIGRVEPGPEVSVWPQTVLRGDTARSGWAHGRRSRTAQGTA